MFDQIFYGLTFGLYRLLMTHLRCVKNLQDSCNLVTCLLSNHICLICFFCFLCVDSNPGPQNTLGRLFPLIRAPSCGFLLLGLLPFLFLFCCSSISACHFTSPCRGPLYWAVSRKPCRRTEVLTSTRILFSRRRRACMMAAGPWLMS